MLDSIKWGVNVFYSCQKKLIAHFEMFYNLAIIQRKI